MEDKVFKATINENGCISVPVTVLDEMQLLIGDTLSIRYLRPTETKERCMLIESKSMEEDDIESFLCIPKDVLEACNINADDGTAHIMCFDREITITNQSKMLSEVPSVVMNLCASLGISDEQIANALAEECCSHG